MGNNGDTILMALLGLALGIMAVVVMIVLMGMQEPASLINGGTGNIVTDIQAVLEPMLAFLGPIMLIVGMVGFTVIAQNKTIGRMGTTYWLLIGVTFLAIVVGLILSLDMIQSLVP